MDKTRELLGLYLEDAEKRYSDWLSACQSRRGGPSDDMMRILYMRRGAFEALQVLSFAAEESRAPAPDPILEAHSADSL